ncbi:START-like domain superfamily [Sesbania bispinosa]|nr:START-like domain superfamily [Sesbania bispinosa]
MGVITFTLDYSSSVAPSRMFTTLIIDSRNLLPKLLPQFVRDVNLIQGDGDVGSIEQVNFNEASPFKYLKHKIDAFDKENLICKYTMIEGDPLGDKLDLRRTSSHGFFAPQRFFCHLLSFTKKLSSCNL